VILLDTHVLIWVVTNSRKPGRATRALVERAWDSGVVAVSAITFWETALLQSKGRLKLEPTPAELRHNTLTSGLTEIAVDGAIGIRAVDVEDLGDDPADRLIVATALVHNATLVTADERLLAWPHSLERQDARA
jgi:PIN domain nuclease of toxin-antitoxin system